MFLEGCQTVISASASLPGCAPWGTGTALNARCNAARPEAAPTGIDYLGLVAGAHEEEAGTGAKIDFTRLGKLSGSDRNQQQEQEEER